MRLSLNEASTFVGDILPIRLIDEGRELCSAEISWECRGEAISIRTFQNGKHAFSDGVLIIARREGEGEVVATLDGVECRATVKVRNARGSSGELHYFLGDLHNHTSRTHKPDEFATQKYGRIEDYLHQINEEGRLDFSVISDHADVTNDSLFFRGFELTRSGEYEKVITLAGAESEIKYCEHDRFGVEHRLSGEIVTLNSAGYAYATDFETLERELSPSPMAVAIFAHPHVVGYSTNGIWDFDYKRRATPALLHAVRGIEMGNGADRNENLLHEYAISAALDAGFRVSTTCASDSHGPNWRYDIMPGKTVIMAYERSREAFIDALRNNRFYATESGNVKLAYTVNGSPAPADLPMTDRYDFHVDLAYFQEDADSRIERLMVMSDYGDCLLSLDVGGKEEIEFTIRSDRARYFYLRLIDRCGRKTWSPPVWCGRAFDKEPLPPLSPIDMSRVRAFTGGGECPKLINGNPYDTTLFDSPGCEVTLDMGSVRTVSALGYYPHLVLRSKEKGKSWETSGESAGIVSHYAITVSEDGEHYSEVKRGRFSSLGIESILYFGKQKARFVRFIALATVGSSSFLPAYKDSPARIANLSLFDTQS